MTVDHEKIYSVKSNARRDARKAGLDPDLVFGSHAAGWRIGRPAPPQEPAAQPSKRDQLRAFLEREGGTSATTLQAVFGWQPHTLRGAISTLAKKAGVKVERYLRDGVTFYRIDQQAAS